MSGVNKVILVGRLGSDPELKQTAGGQSVCTLSLATSESWKDAQGQRQEKTEWHRVVVWGRSADNCAKFLAKGRQVYIEGRLQTRSWEGQDGAKKYTTEIVATTVQFLSAGAGTGASSGGYDNSHSQQEAPDSNFSPEPMFDSSEEVPF